MPDDQSPRTRSQGMGTRLSHAGRAGTRIRGFVNPPLLRGSTMLYPSCDDRRASAATRSPAASACTVSDWPIPEVAPVMNQVRADGEEGWEEVVMVMSLAY